VKRRAQGDNPFPILLVSVHNRGPTPALCSYRKGRKVELGSGGCPAPDISANRALYILDFTTDKFMKITVPADSGDAVAINPIMVTGSTNLGRHTHPLAWYNRMSISTYSDVYMFITGDSQKRLLLTDTRDFMWR